MSIYTIGYEGLSIDEYIAKLNEANINVVVDVRRNPISRKPGFSKTKMRQFLANAGIDYLHFPELGIESSLRRNLKTAQDIRNLLAHYESVILPEHQHDIERLGDTIKDINRIAFTCFEKRPDHCHRSVLARWMHNKFNFPLPVHI